MSLDLVNVPGAARLMAGFQVSINGRFWVSTEANLRNEPVLMRLKELEVLEKVAARANLQVLFAEKGLADRVMKLI